MEVTAGPYRVSGLDEVRTPALLICAEPVQRNIATTVRLLGAPERWRPHLKTAKLRWTMEQLRAAGVAQAKCATPLELETACAAGFEDVMVAYPVVRSAVRLVRAIAARYPSIRVSALVEDAAMVSTWRGSPVGLFIDLDPGMHRTGMEPDHDRVLELAREIGRHGLEWRGLHYYDGQASGPAVLTGYERLLRLAGELRRRGLDPAEIVTSGTTAFPMALGYRGFTESGYRHTLSPGTLVYCDVRSLGDLAELDGYAAGAMVLTRVVSHPGHDRITCDAGHKTVSADAGDPTCAVLDHAGWTPRHPSEEHLPIDLPAGEPLPDRGAPLWLVPRHVCPTVNNFDAALIVAGGRIQRVEAVTARGRHPPIATEPGGADRG